MCSKHLRPYSCPLRPWFHYSYGGQFLPLASTLPQANAAGASLLSRLTVFSGVSGGTLGLSHPQRGVNASRGKYLSFFLVETS